MCLRCGNFNYGDSNISKLVFFGGDIYGEHTIKLFFLGLSHVGDVNEVSHVLKKASILETDSRIDILIFSVIISSPVSKLLECNKHGGS